VVSSTRTEKIERLLRSLVWAETHLDGDLSLAVLAEVAGLSPHHFHRLFRACIGETARQYVQRLRLDRGAFLLTVDSCSVLDVALDVGFHNHETFSRAFKRRFGQSPSSFRRERRRALMVHREARRQTRSDGFESRLTGQLSKTVVRELKPMHVAFIRHLGDYELVPPTLFDELVSWYRTSGYNEDCLLMGVGHDAPGFTPTEELRFDACVRVPEPFSPQGRIGCRTIPGGYVASTTHVGPFDTLSSAWAEVFGRVRSIKGYEATFLPVIEMYHATQVTPDYALSRTDLCMQLVRA
jgi:AraC family transcriptional regulator